jgi:hypothetical protein
MGSKCVSWKTYQTMDIHTWFKDACQKASIIYDTMNYKTSPTYGNVVFAMEQIGLLGHHMLASLADLQTWVSSYKKDRLWFEYVFKKACSSVEYYKSYGPYDMPPKPDMEFMREWSRVEQLYKGPLDIRFDVAVQAAYNVAAKSRKTPYRHEGEHMGGLFCIYCEDDEWKWQQECLKEADMPNNVFWNKTLQPAFLEEMKDNVTAPSDWCYPLVEKKDNEMKYEMKSTPFQCAVHLTYHVSKWLPFYSRHTTDLELYEWLSKHLPTLEAKIQEDMDRAEDILTMF